MDDFYKYIIMNKNSYSIMKDNEKYGTYRRLEDALYERDRLVQSDWDWEDALALSETENQYYNMNLPKFRNGSSHIYRIIQTYKVYKDDKYMDRFNNKRDAYAYAKEIDGSVVHDNIRYRICRTINGKSHYYGQYATMEEAIMKRDELIKNGWKQ